MDRDRIYFSISSNRLIHAYQGWGLTAREWRQGGDRVDTFLNNLSKMLNSNEQFKMDDSFNLSYVRAGPYGGGKRRLLPRNLSSTRLRLNKRSVIPIPRTTTTCVVPGPSPLLKPTQTIIPNGGLSNAVGPSK